MTYFPANALQHFAFGLWYGSLIEGQNRANVCSFGKLIAAPRREGEKFLSDFSRAKSEFVNS